MITYVSQCLKLCSDAICEPLQMIFNQALIFGSFPTDWKRPTLSLNIKKQQTNLNKTIVQFPCSLFVVKSSEDLF